jgi:hypothetical protein
MRDLFLLSKFGSPFFWMLIRSLITVGTDAQHSKSIFKGRELLDVTI